METQSDKSLFEFMIVFPNFHCLYSNLLLRTMSLPNSEEIALLVTLKLLY